MSKPRLTAEQNVGLAAMLQEIAPKGRKWYADHGTHRAGRKVLELLRHHNAMAKEPLSGGALQDFFKRVHPLARREAGQPATQEEVAASAAKYGGSGRFSYEDAERLHHHHVMRPLLDAVHGGAAWRSRKHATGKRGRSRALPVYNHDPRVKFAEVHEHDPREARRVTTATIKTVRTVDFASDREHRLKKLRGGNGAPVPINNGATGNAGRLEQYDRLDLPKANIQYTGTFGQPQRTNLLK